MLPKQVEFVRDVSTRHLLYSGAFAAGKSRTLCWKLRMRAEKPGAVEMLCRKTLESLKKSTLRTLLEPDGELPPILEPGTYTHNKPEKTIKIHGGGEILYFGLDDPAKLGSVNATGCAIDELVDCTEADYTMLKGRVRMKVPGLPHQFYSACNPGPPSHWVATAWGLDPGGSPMGDNYRVIQASALENVFLSDDYLADLEQLTGVAYERYVLGKWVGSDGLIFDGFQRDTHVTSERLPAVEYRYCVDPGYTDPFAIYEREVDQDGRVHTSREFYQPGVTHADAIDVLREMMHDRTCPLVVDSAEPAFIEECQRAGFAVKGARKGPDSILSGIQLMQQRLRDPGDGKPRWTINPACPNLIREMESYEWARSNDGLKEKPVDANNHGIDANRYDFAELDGGTPFVFVSAGEGDRAGRKERSSMSIAEIRDADPEWGWDG